MENCPSGLCAGMSCQQCPGDLSNQANLKLQFGKSNIPFLEIPSGKVREQHCDIEWLCAGMPCQQSPVDLSNQANPKLQFGKFNIPF